MVFLTFPFFPFPSSLPFLSPLFPTSFCTSMTPKTNKQTNKLTNPSYFIYPTFTGLPAGNKKRGQAVTASVGTDDRASIVHHSHHPDYPSSDSIGSQTMDDPNFFILASLPLHPNQLAKAEEDVHRFYSTEQKAATGPYRHPGTQKSNQQQQQGHRHQGNQESSHGDSVHSQSHSQTHTRSHSIVPGQPLPFSSSTDSRSLRGSYGEYPHLHHTSTTTYTTSGGPQPSLSLSSSVAISAVAIGMQTAQQIEDAILKVIVVFNPFPPPPLSLPPPLLPPSLVPHPFLLPPLRTTPLTPLPISHPPGPQSSSRRMERRMVHLRKPSHRSLTLSILSRPSLRPILSRTTISYFHSLGTCSPGFDAD